MIYRLYRCLDNEQGLSYDGLRAQDQRGTTGTWTSALAHPQDEAGETQDGHTCMSVEPQSLLLASPHAFSCAWASWTVPLAVETMPRRAYTS